MVLMLLSLLLILAVAFYQAVQGLFSALVMSLATLAAVLIAFNYYEMLAGPLYPHLHGAAEAVSLMALLAIPLLVLRLLLDRFLSVNVVPHMWVDRIGGGVFGLFTALLLIGTLLVAMQMLPFDRSIGGYDAYSDRLEPNGLFPYADEFVIGLVKKLSRSSMSPINAQPEEVFGYAHDDLKLELWGTRNRPHLASTSVLGDDFQVLGLWDVTDAPSPSMPGSTYGQAAPEYAYGNTLPSRVLVARVRVGASARDEDNTFRVSGTQFRLVASDGTSFYPVEMASTAAPARPRPQPQRPQSQEESAPAQKDEIGNRMLIQAGSDSQAAGLVVDLTYRVPNASLTAEPRRFEFMTFRRMARQAVPQVVVGPVPGKP